MTLGELRRSGNVRYTWVDYGADARLELRGALNQALENGYENILINSAMEVAGDLGDYAPEFEGCDAGELEGWVREWQQDNGKETK